MAAGIQQRRTLQVTDGTMERVFARPAPDSTFTAPGSLRVGHWPSPFSGPAEQALLCAAGGSVLA
jgi:hypothetical protein